MASDEVMAELEFREGEDALAALVAAVEDERQARSEKDAEEDGLAPSQVVDLCRAVRRGPISLMWNGSASGYVAIVNGHRWNPYGLLSELLEDIGAAPIPVKPEGETDD